MTIVIKAERMHTLSCCKNDVSSRHRNGSVGVLVRFALHSELKNWFQINEPIVIVILLSSPDRKQNLNRKDRTASLIKSTHLYVLGKEVSFYPGLKKVIN